MSVQLVRDPVLWSTSQSVPYVPAKGFDGAPDGGVYVTSGSAASGGRRAYRLDASGQLLWERTYQPSDPIGNVIDVSPFDGTVYTARSSDVIGRLDPGGDIVATTTIDPAPGRLWTFGTDLAATADGGVIVVAKTRAASPDFTPTNSLTVSKLDASAHIVWSRSFEYDTTTFDNGGVAAVSTSDGQVVVAAQRFEDAGNGSTIADGFELIGLNGADGATRWTRTFELYGQGLGGIEAAPGGAVYIVADSRILAVDADGNDRWIRNNTYGSTAAVLPDGTLAVLGYRDPAHPTDPNDVSSEVVGLITPEGTTIDTLRFRPPSPTLTPRLLTTDALGNVYSLGWDYPAELEEAHNVVVSRLDPTMTAGLPD